MKHAIKRVISGSVRRAARYLATRHPLFADDVLNEFAQQRFGTPVPLGHYYSPLPDIHELERRMARWNVAGWFDPIRWDVSKQAAFLQKLLPYKAESEKLPSAAAIAKQGYGLGYGEVESQILYCMIRNYQPRQVIEVGAGVSTYFILHAGAENAAAPSVTSIEPYPSQKIIDLAERKNISLIHDQVQNVPLSTFQSLGASDILFIDSSHSSKLDSDVNWLYLELLPRLNPGVVIHIHDIVFPYLTTPPDHFMLRHSMIWNECTVLKALLTQNNAFEVLMCQSQIHHEKQEALRDFAVRYSFPSSLWLRKVS
jgi:predicted O-methyltransferase YrrM